MNLTPGQKLALEMWLAQRAKLHGIFIDAGVSSTESRKPLMRAGLRPFAHLTCGKVPGGKVQTYAEVYERVYGESLLSGFHKDPAAHTARRDAEVHPVSTE